MAILYMLNVKRKHCEAREKAFRIFRAGLSDPACMAIDQSNCVFYCGYYIMPVPILHFKSL